MARPDCRLARLLVLVTAGALQACGGGGGGGSSPPPPQPEPLPVVTISGQARYEFVPPNANCRGLDFNNIRLRPIRQATIQLLDAATNDLVASGVTDDGGNFSLMVDADSDVTLRVRAELKRAGTPGWNVEVRDNFDDTEPPEDRPLLGQRPMYVLDGTPFNVGAADSTHDVTATTGWGVNSYTGVRAAAPFAILDTVYAAMSLILAEDPQLVFEPLDVYWSVNNVATGGDPDVDAGELPTSFYGGNQLFLLGMDGSDTEEFDDHVIAHEWGHYFEDVFSRSDTIGGAHSLGQLLDMRVAFGEGWATALSGIALDNPEYCDTSGPGNQSGFAIDIEEPKNMGQPGWYNELSVVKVLYDLWDDDPDGADTGSLGFTPIFDVMTGPEAVTPAFTSIFSFAAALKTTNGVDPAFVDALLAADQITAEDPYGSTETNDASQPQDLFPPQDVLPLYTNIVPDGSTLQICSNSQFDRSGGGALRADGNKVSEYRFLRMTLDSAARLDVSVTTTDETVAMLPPDDPDDDRDQSDPDIRIFRNGEQIGDGVMGLSGVANSETFTTPSALPAGDYVMDLTEFRYQDDETATDFPARSCFDVAITAVP